MRGPGTSTPTPSCRTTTSRPPRPPGGWRSASSTSWGRSGHRLVGALDPLGAGAGEVGPAPGRGGVRVGLVGDGVVVHLGALGGDVEHAVAVGVHVQPLHMAV